MARDSDAWSAWHEQQLPSGYVEVEHKLTEYTTRLAVDIPELPDVVYVNPGSKLSRILAGSNTAKFQIQDVDPNGNPLMVNFNGNISTSVWTSVVENPPPKSEGPYITVHWAFGGGGTAVFRYTFTVSAFVRAYGQGNPLVAVSGEPLVGNENVFGRDFPAVKYCGNSPESWVRGAAWLDVNTGILSYKLELETDSTLQGPVGHIEIIAKDAPPAI